MAPEFTWRKTKDGEWVICGPAKILRQAAKTYTAVQVASRSGATKWVQVARVGKTFGDGLAYGYLDGVAPASTSRTATGQGCDECGRHGARHPRTDSSGIPGTVCDGCSREPSYALSFA